MSNYDYPCRESPVEQACYDLRQLQRDLDSIIEYLTAVQASKEQNQKVFQSVEACQDNYKWTTVSKRYLLTRIRAQKTEVEKKIKAAQAKYDKMERIAKG